MLYLFPKFLRLSTPFVVHLTNSFFFNKQIYYFFLFFTTCVWCNPLQGWHPRFFFFRKCSRCHPDLRMLPTHSFFSNIFIFTFFTKLIWVSPFRGWHPGFFSPKITLGVTPFCDASKHSFFSYKHINIFFLFFSLKLLWVSPPCVSPPSGFFTLKKF